MDLCEGWPKYARISQQKLMQLKIWSMIVFFFFGFCLSEDLPIGRILSEKKHRGKELVAEKTRKFCKQNLTKERKQPPEVTPQQGIFYNVFILCLWLRIIVSSDQGV